MIGINLQPDREIPAQLELLRRCGFRHAALAVEQLGDAAEVRRGGFQIDHCHLSFGDMSRDIWLEHGAEAEALFRTELEACAAQGVPYAVMHLKHGKTPPLLTPQGLERHLRLLDLAYALGIVLCYENQASQEHLLRFFAQVKAHPAAGITFDFGHAYLNGHLSLLAHEMLRGRVKVIHVHTNDRITDRHLLPLTLPGIPWGHVLEQLKETGYQGPILLEVFKSAMYDGLTEEQYLRLAAEQAHILETLYGKEGS